MYKSAKISDCGKFRYILKRQWNNDKPHILFIMLNPSTADAKHDDPTLRRCMNFAAKWGYGGIEVVNLFAFRATLPRELLSAEDAVGPENDDHIREALGDTPDVLCAWGVDGAINDRDKAVLEILKATDPNDRLILCLEKTKNGHPKHPLYCAGNLKPIRFI